MSSTCAARAASLPIAAAPSAAPRPGGDRGQPAPHHVLCRPGREPEPQSGRPGAVAARTAAARADPTARAASRRNHRTEEVMEIIGWDIGGAHLKLARLRDGKVLELRQVACALWQGVDRLAAAIDEGLAGWPAPGRHALTMTGELADIFPDRASGVRAILATVAQHLDRAAIAVYASDGAFLAAESAADSPERVSPAMSSSIAASCGRLSWRWCGTSTSPARASA